MNLNQTVDVDTTRNYRLVEGDCRKRLSEVKEQSIDFVFTSPPPFTVLTDMQDLVATCRQIHRVLRNEGTLWIDIGDRHDEAGDLSLWGQDFIFGMVCNTHLWDLKDRLIWHKPPTNNNKYDYQGLESQNRFKNDYDFILGFTKRGHGSNRYFDKSQTDAWTTSVLHAPVRDVKLGEADSGFPHEIIADCLLATCPPGGTVLDPFCGWGATGVVALQNGMNFIGIEKDRSMISKINKRLAKEINNG